MKMHEVFLDTLREYGCQKVVQHDISSTRYLLHCSDLVFAPLALRLQPLLVHEVRQEVHKLTP